MNRRRLLLSYIANSFSWELYSKTYFYNELVPTTINTKNVLNKAKVSKIYGNGVIENQLVINGNFEDNSGWYMANTGSTITTSNNVATITKANNSALYLYRANADYTTFVANHKYLAKAVVKPSASCQLRFISSSSYGTLTNISANTNTLLAQILSPTSTSGFVLTLDDNNTLSVGATLEVSDYIFIDLTLREGTGNEPTLLTDNRIQNILNRGYIPYNLGEYKGTDIGEFKSEPYNLCDNDFENGFINNGSDLSISYCVRTPHTRPIEVLPNVSYTFSVNSAQYKYAFIVEYDENMGFIKQNGATNNTSTTATMSANTKYIRLVYGDKDNTTITTIPSPSDSQPCLFRTGTRTGYAPYKAPSTISFKYQGNGAINSHDTMEIGKDNVVFTKNVGSVDLGSLSYTLTNNNYFTATISNMKIGEINSTLNNALCEKYPVYSNLYRDGYADKGINYGYNGGGFSIRLKDTSISTDNPTTFKNGLTNTMFEYELATPQVITIPRKHLGIVDLGSLSWGYNSQSGHERFYANVSSNNLKGAENGTLLANLYCSKYMTQKTNDTQNRVIGIGAVYISSTNTQLQICDTNFTNATDFKNAMAGTLLFYETENEVADITDTIDIESGGTITTDSEVLPNVELKVKCK